MNPANAVAKVRSITHAVRNRDPIRGDEPLAPGSGNYLAKSRRNFYVSRTFWEILHYWSLRYGVNHSNMLEIMGREWHVNHGQAIPEIEYHDGRKAR